MKYQVGDEIIVLHTQEEGKVTEIINDKMVMIEVRGVKFPAYMDQIDFPYFYRFTKNKLVPEKKEKPKTYIDQIPTEKPKPNQIKSEDGVSLALIPKFSFDEYDDELVEYLKVYLVNKTDKTYEFTYDYYISNRSELGLKNTIHAFEDFYIHDIPFDALSLNPTLECSFTPKQPQKTDAPMAEYAHKLRAKQMFLKIEQMKKDNVPSILFPLFKQYPSKQEQTNQTSVSVKPHTKQPTQLATQKIQPKSVLDLHIHKLTNDWKNLSKFEILNMQLSSLEKWVYVAINHFQPNLIVIHGIGEGKLKDEVHQFLKHIPEVDYFVNQYHPSYGFGATEVFFKY